MMCNCILLSPDYHTFDDDDNTDCKILREEINLVGLVKDKRLPIPIHLGVVE